MRWFDRTGGACRTRGTRDPSQIERDHHGFSLDKRKSQIRGVGHALEARAVHSRVRYTFDQAIFQSIAQQSNSMTFFPHMLQRQFRRLSQACDAGNIFGAGATVALRMSTVKQRFEIRTLANVEGPDTLWAVQLMRGNRKQMHAELRNVDRNLPCRLHSVRVERDMRFSSNFADLLNRLNRAQLIIRDHDCDEYGLRPDRSPNVFRIDEAFAVNRQNGHGDATFFQRV